MLLAKSGYNSAKPSASAELDTKQKALCLHVIPAFGNTLLAVRCYFLSLNCLGKNKSISLSVQVNSSPLFPSSPSPICACL